MRADVKQWLEGLKTPGLPDESEAKGLLRLFGIPTPKGFRLNPGEPVPPKLPAPSYVAKVCSGDILHKTDQCGVLLNLDAEALTKAVNDLRERFSSADVLIEEQVRFQGTEFIVGALVDPDFGPAVMAGAGGVLTELYEDVAFRLAPCPVHDALSMIGELTVSPVFSGFRGLALNRDGLARVISQAGTLALELGDRFSQLDINPIVCSDGEWIALDAKLVLNPA